MFAKETARWVTYFHAGIQKNDFLWPLFARSTNDARYSLPLFRRWKSIAINDTISPQPFRMVSARHSVNPLRPSDAYMWVNRVVCSARRRYLYQWWLAANFTSRNKHHDFLFTKLENNVDMKMSFWKCLLYDVSLYSGLSALRLH